jgi:hypothetical protein
MARSPLIAAWQVEIDIGPLAALFGKKTFKEQIHANGIDCRNPEHITNSAVCGGPAALDKNAVAAAELNDVPDNQEVAFKRQLLDKLKFTLNLFPVTLCKRTITLARACIDALAQERSHRFAIRNRVARKLISEVLPV